MDCAFDRAPYIVSDFLDAAFIPAFKNDYEESIEDYEGNQYRTWANLTINERGVIALAAAESLLDEVVCSDPGTIKITFVADIDEAFIDRMFPNGTMLAVEGVVLGSCFFGLDVAEANFTLNAVNDTLDGYLFIATARASSANKREVIISGTPSSFLFMFDEADIVVKKLEVNETGDVRRLKEWERFVGKQYPEVRDARLKLYAGVRLKIFVSFDFDCKFKLRKGITLIVDFGFQVTVIPELGMSILTGIERRGDTYSSFFPEIPIFALPRTRISSRLGITQAKLGIYLEVGFFLDYILNYNQAASIKAFIGFTTGRKTFRYTLTGGWGGLDFDATTLTNEKAKLIEPAITTTVSNGISGNGTVYAGLKPGVSLYILGFAKAGVYQRTGAEFKVRATTSGLVSKSPNGLEIGNCAACHIFNAAADLVVENLSWFAKYKIVIDVWWFPTIRRRGEIGDTLPGELHLDLFQVCALERKDLTPCSNQCCTPGYKCVSGFCDSIFE